MTRLLLIALTWSSLVQAGPKDDALAAYDKFFTSFTTGNQAELASLFAPDALFYGTGSVEVVTTSEGVIAYFTEALSGARGETKARPFERRWSSPITSWQSQVNGNPKELLRGKWLRLGLRESRS
jgi:hypothetical protein